MKFEHYTWQWKLLLGVLTFCFLVLYFMLKLPVPANNNNVIPDIITPEPNPQPIPQPIFNGTVAEGEVLFISKKVFKS